MKQAVVFTICARNYLAQAMTLRDSVLRHNPEFDFLIFLADAPLEAEITPAPTCIVNLAEDIVPNWHSMAFKYNVIEFSTSIKPFCIRHLFATYERVIYLDPDTYVTSSLSPIVEWLEHRDVVITPHYNNLQVQYSGAVPEEEILFVGIYNLGFFAIKRSSSGTAIIEWWCNRLADKCFADKHDALHVDQRWIDFLPAFFPGRVEICHHPGLNVAIWNLHERSLAVSERGYEVHGANCSGVFPLIFFHFSGFDPKNPRLINRRHPDYNVDSFPSFESLFMEYAKKVLGNDYERISRLPYHFNAFSSGEKILPLHRRMYRVLLNDLPAEDPFQVSSRFYQMMVRHRLLTGLRSYSFDSGVSQNLKDRAVLLRGLVWGCARILRRVVGIRLYYQLLVFLADFSRLESQAMLIRRNKPLRRC